MTKTNLTLMSSDEAYATARRISESLANEAAPWTGADEALYSALEAKRTAVYERSANALSSLIDTHMASDHLSAEEKQAVIDMLIENASEVIDALNIWVLIHPST